jgi:hypothetical protein
LQQVPVAFGLTNLICIINVFSIPNGQRATVEECDFVRQFLFDECVAISQRYDLKMVS